jgi:shikimate kinase
MKDGKPIVLIGFMATGKSTVGRLLATRYGLRFIDLDEAIESTAAMTIPDIFRLEGEASFRQRERAALLETLSAQDTVIATGGGAACQPGNLQAMLASGTVVALGVSAEEAIRRTADSSGRPLLDGQGDRLVKARELLESREPYYNQAHLRVETDGKEPTRIAFEVGQALDLRTDFRNETAKNNEKES